MVLRVSRQMFRRTLEEYPATAARIADEVRRRVQEMSVELAGVKERLRRIGIDHHDEES